MEDERYIDSLVPSFLRCVGFCVSTHHKNLVWVNPDIHVLVGLITKGELFGLTRFPRYPDFRKSWEVLVDLLQTIAPGCRLGWFTCNPLFAERIERAAETSTHAPSGFSQVENAICIYRLFLLNPIRRLYALSCRSGSSKVTYGG